MERTFVDWMFAYPYLTIFALIIICDTLTCIAKKIGEAISKRKEE